MPANENNPRFIGYVNEDELLEYTSSLYTIWYYAEQRPEGITESDCVRVYEEHHAIVQAVAEQFDIDDCYAWTIEPYSGVVHYTEDVPAKGDS